jgi:hypothetical protein
MHDRVCSLQFAGDGNTQRDVWIGQAEHEFYDGSLRGHLRAALYAHVQCRLPTPIQLRVQWPTGALTGQIHLPQPHAHTAVRQD